jgi:tRNA threonylcarbamoyl adenosine modification protein (Sua5/YciO/YrdC/YwlC family)
MTPILERERVDDAAPPKVLRDRVESVLAHGGLAVLPTETVYGIAARADDPRGIEALRSLKSRPRDLALTWHVGTAEAIDRFPSVSALVRRLVAKYWPGPLTLVLPGVPPGLESAAREGWTGIRMPAHRATAGILADLPFPVVMSSANRHGDRPPASAEEVARAFDHHGGEGGRGEGRIELLVDGGPAPLAESSCVLRLGKGRFDVLREGVIGVDQLRATAGLRLGFACTGNTCRSPMAEGWAKHRIAERLEIAPERLEEFGFVLESMGVLAGHGMPAARFAIQLLKESGVDISGHRSRAASARDFSAYDKVYCMTRGHREALARSLPPGKDGNVELLDPSGRDVPDPIGGTREDYVEAFGMIREAIEKRLEEWA